MNSEQLYQWTREIDKHFSGLGRWQKVLLAVFSYGVILAENCRLNKVAQKLSGGERREQNNLERRLQRWLANERLPLERMIACWVKWFLQRWGNAPLLVLVDETKLRDHLAVMMVSASYQGSAIPLIWRAYSPHDYPEEGQVGILNELLGRLKRGLPPDLEAVVLADRGLGTSPAWQERLMQTGWDYLLRVQRTTRIQLKNGEERRIGSLVGYGQRWFGQGQVFKKSGWRWQSVFVMWEPGYEQPWCLISNRLDHDPMLYAWRYRQEAGFRDLKSDGFNWQQSRVWMPDHLERFRLVLALATFWTLAMGTAVLYFHPLTARDRRYSTFRLGLQELFRRFHNSKFTWLDLFLAPDTPSLKSVVT